MCLESIHEYILIDAFGRESLYFGCSPIYFFCVGLSYVYTKVERALVCTDTCS